MKAVFIPFTQISLISNHKYLKSL